MRNTIFMLSCKSKDLINELGIKRNMLENSQIDLPLEIDFDKIDDVTKIKDINELNRIGGVTKNDKDEGGTKSSSSEFNKCIKFKKR